MRILILSFIAILGFAFSFSVKYPKLKPSGFYSLKIKEPSDICLSADGLSFYIVSDNGILYKTDLEGKILQTAAHTGIDFEAVYADDMFVYVCDETPRKVHIFNVQDLSLHKTVSLNYFGGRNKGFESITYNPLKDVFVLITERDPIYIREYSKDFHLLNEIEYKHARDISAATYYNGFLYFLSDEDMTIFKISPTDYSIIDGTTIPIVNPEGLAFDKQGKMYVVSDDMERLYYFNEAFK